MIGNAVMLLCPKISPGYLLPNACPDFVVNVREMRQARLQSVQDSIFLVCYLGRGHEKNLVGSLAHVLEEAEFIEECGVKVSPDNMHNFRPHESLLVTEIPAGLKMVGC